MLLLDDENRIVKGYFVVFLPDNNVPLSKFDFRTLLSFHKSLFISLYNRTVIQMENEMVCTAVQTISFSI